MKLRDRLFVFSAAQLVVFGALFAAGYLALHDTVLPMLSEHLYDKTRTRLEAAASQLDLPLAADDRKLVAPIVGSIERDPDFAYVEIRDARQIVVYSAGALPSDAFDGPPRTVADHEGNVRGWAEISLEGVKLGTVAIAYDTGRIERILAWVRLFTILIATVWLAAVIYSIAVARSFAAPIRAMMQYSRKVAAGDFSNTLDVKAGGELRELVVYLNAMTRELASREQEREVAAARTEAMQRELLSVSRMAGMAEVATGVLHNVGNVLTSLNVSVATAEEQMRGSRVASLSKTVELYSAHPGGLTGFLGTDKGKLLPEFLASVSKRLVEENALVRGELASVMSNVAHIKTIVSMQQQYARISGASESVDLGTVIADALQMGEASFVRHRIELVKEVAPGLPAVVSDRHKVLQILVNLISNARHALKESGSETMRLTVRATAGATGVAIAVTDTGVGISAENLARIFQHGFTTKRNGHGFGLHVSANFARELGGDLVAVSDGLGHGATFTLTLPLQAPSRDHDDHN
jgi:signal transduction histidine kinase